MKIDEAIETLESMLPSEMPNNPPRRLDAYRLGIEALKRIKERRDLKTGWEIQLLPGETED